VAKPGWYNENTGRDYPTVFSRYPLAEWLSDGRGTAGEHTNYLLIKDSPSVLVDFGCVMGVTADFVEGEHTVWLESIRKTDDYVDFEFYSDAPGLADHKLVFTRDLTDEDYEIEYAQSVPKDRTSLNPVPDSDVAQSLCPDITVLWEGFLVTKDIAKLGFISGGPNEVVLEFGNPGNLQVEPGLIQNLAEHYLRTVNLFNGNRTRAENSSSCRPLCWDADYYTNAVFFTLETCLQGDIRFSEGYNCFITEDRFNNKLTINAGVGQGLGEPGEEVPFWPNEEAPQGRSLLDGSIACNETIRTLNGMQGPHIEIVGGQGVTVQSLPEQNLVIVSVDMTDLAGCFDQEVSTSLNEVPVNPDPCDCGPAIDP
jgi:hypothetical protein